MPNALRTSFAAVLGEQVSFTYKSMESTLVDREAVEAKCRLVTGEVISLDQVAVLSDELVALSGEDAEHKECVVFCRPELIVSIKVVKTEGERPRNPVGFSVTIAPQGDLVRSEEE